MIWCWFTWDGSSSWLSSKLINPKFFSSLSLDSNLPCKSHRNAKNLCNLHNISRNLQRFMASLHLSLSLIKTKKVLFSKKKLLQPWQEHTNKTSLLYLFSKKNSRLFYFFFLALLKSLKVFFSVCNFHLSMYLFYNTINIKCACKVSSNK